MNRNKNIYFGSLEDQVSLNEEKEKEEIDNFNEISVTHPKNNQKPQSQSQFQGQEREQESEQSREQTQEFDRRSLAKTLRIPTDDPSVRRLLISLNQPITLFGEGPGERRDRLRLMASKAICSLPRALELFPVLKTLLGEEDANHKSASNDNDEDYSEEFYVPGSIDLIKIRSFLLDDSISRSRQRKSLDHVTEHNFRKSLYEKVSSTIDLNASFMDSNGRPLSACTFTKNNGHFYTGDWSGRIIRYVGSSSSELIKNFQERITAISSDSENGILIGTAAGRIEYNDHVISESTTHAIKSLNWHPSDQFFASCSIDSLWKLWDAQTGTELQVQEGHLGGTGAGTWHPDGAIYCTGGSTDGIIRIWDCRSGKSVWNISCKRSVAITSLAFAPLTPNLLASSNSDGLVSFHDLRKVEVEYLKVAAHRSCCSSLKFTGQGRILASSGFDGSVRLWCPGDLRLLKDLPVGSNSKVTDFDVHEDASGGIKIGAVTFDRNVKIFS